MQIKMIKRFQFEATEEEVKAMARMLAFYAQHSPDMDSDCAGVLKAFGIAANEPEAEDEEERDETLPEKAIRVAQGRRKGRVTARVE